MNEDQTSMLSKVYRSLPNFKGKQRLGRLVLKNLIKTTSDIIIRGKHHIKYLVPNLRENIGYEIFINGIYEKETSNFIISKIPDGGVYVDIGANIGSIAIPVCISKKNITAVCIEASLSVFKYLEENISLNDLPNFILVNRAISDTDGAEVSFYSPTDQFGKGHISNNADELLQKVKTIRLDSLLFENNISTVDFIKVDIEGYEYYAFLGAEKLLTSPNAPDIIFEFEHWAEERAFDIKAGDAQKLLISYGYNLFAVNSKEKISALTTPLTHGSVMIWASKQFIHV